MKVPSVFVAGVGGEVLGPLWEFSEEEEREVQ